MILSNSTFCLLLSALLVTSQTSASAIPTNSSEDNSKIDVKKPAIDGRLISQIHPLPTEDVLTPKPLKTTNRSPDAIIDTAGTTTTKVSVPVSHSNGQQVPEAVGGFTPSIFVEQGQASGVIPGKSNNKLPSARVLQRRRASIQYPGVVRKFDTNGNGNGNGNTNTNIHSSEEGQLYAQTPLLLKLRDTGNGNVNEVGLTKENPMPAVNTLFDSVLHTHSHSIVQAPGLPSISGSDAEKIRLYYGDVGAGKSSQSASTNSDPNTNANGDEGAAHTGHISLHAQLDNSNYYYPQNLLSKQPLVSVYKHLSHQNSAQSHDLGHNTQQSHHHSSLDDSHLSHLHTIPHHTYGHSGYQHDYRGHSGHGNPIGPVIGKALQLLIPSALFLTGASALFPNRVHVPTNDNESKQNERIKRSARSSRHSYGGSSYAMPSAYLRREHRGDDYGPEVYDDNHEDYFDESASNQFGERVVPNPDGDGNTTTVSQPDNDNKATAPTETPLKFPDFKPMPVLPVLRLNTLGPVSSNNFDNKDNLGETEAENAKGTTMSDLNSTTGATTLMTDLPTNPTPLEVMSKLLKASLHPSHSTTPPSSTTERATRRASDGTTITLGTSLKSTRPTTSRSAVVISSKKLNNFNVQLENISSREKPFFRQVSTEKPNVIFITPESKTSTSTSTTKRRRMPTPPAGKIVTRQAYGKRASNFDSFESITSQSGPNIIELGGETEESVVGITGRNKESAVIGKSSSFVKANTTSTPKGNSSGLLDDDELDLSPDSPVVGLITNFAARDQESPQCQKRALCELAVRGSKETSSKFEKFLWNLANLVPSSLSMYYDLQDTFGAVVARKCSIFKCANPNLDLQEG